MPGTFSPQPRVSDPDMHHGTCVTHVPWCMPGSLTSSFLWSRWRGKTFPAHAQPAILRIWQEAHVGHVESWRKWPQIYRLVLTDNGRHRYNIFQNYLNWLRMLRAICIRSMDWTLWLTSMRHSESESSLWDHRHFAKRPCRKLDLKKNGQNKITNWPC